MSTTHQTNQFEDRVFLNIKINGFSRQIVAKTIYDLIHHELLSELQSSTFAIAVNECFVSKQDYVNTPIKNGDAIEIVSPMSGG